MENLNCKVSSKRWGIAQESEKEYWDSYSKDPSFFKEMENHKNKARILEERWKTRLNLKKTTKILQIGCGPEDVITHFSLGKRYAVDPLADFYKSKFNLDYGNLTFLKARGEELPFKDNSFDIVLLTNVLDHTEDPKKVLSEIRRVLKKDGFFYFENFFYQRKFIFLAKIFGFLKETFTNDIFNVHHPWMFSLEGVKKTLISNGFSILHQNVGESLLDGIGSVDDLIKVRRKDAKFRTRLLAYFGIYGIINYTAVCKKKEN